MATWFTDSWSSLTGWTARWRGDAWSAATDLVAPSGGASDWNGLTLDAVDSDANRADVDLLAVVRFSSLAARRYPLVVRASGADESARNYSLAISATALRIYECLDTDAPSQVTTTSGTISAATDTDYWVRFRVSGNSPAALKAKFWSGSAADEPGGVATDASWTLSITGSNVPAAGWVGVSAYAADGVSIWKQLGVGTNGDWGPSSAGSGGTTLTASLFSNSGTFYNATVTTGAVTLTLSLFSNSPTFYSATLSQAGGTQALTPALFTNSATFYTHVISQAGGSQTLLPGLYSNSASFYTHTVTRGAVNLAPPYYENAQTFYAAVLSLSGTNLLPALFSNTATFYNATVTTGSAVLTQSSTYSNTSLFYPAVVAIPGNTAKMYSGSWIRYTRVG